MRKRDFDGFFCGSEDGRLCEVFEPRWWRLDRRVRWWLTPKAERAALKVCWFKEGGGVETSLLRARPARRVRLPNVPRV